MNKGKVVRILDFSAVDGPGNRMVVFLQGCNLNCLYCHNPETIPLGGGCRQGRNQEPQGTRESPCEGSCTVCGLMRRDRTEQETVSFQWMTVEAVVARYRRARPFVSGVTFSGGECTLQEGFLLEVCRALKAEGAHILIDTNGEMSPETLKGLAETVDGFMPDIKALDPEVHRQLTGMDNRRILEAFETMLALGKLAEVRTVLMEEGSDSVQTVAWVAERLGRSAPEVPYRLIRYRPYGVRSWCQEQVAPPREETVRRCVEMARSQGVKNLILI